MASDNKEKEKSITNAEINEVGITELCPTPQQTQSDEAEAVSNEEVRNEFGPNTGFDQKNQTQFASDEEGSIKTLNAGRDGTQHLMEAKILADTDPQMEYGAEDFTTDPRGDDTPVVAGILFRIDLIMVESTRLCRSECLLYYLGAIYLFCGLQNVQSYIITNH